MPTSVQQLIEAAYARSSANDPGKLAEDLELIGFTNRLYQAMYAAMAAASPEQFLTRVSVTLAGGVGGLPDETIDVRRVQSASGLRVNISPIEELDRLWQFAPVVFQEGNNLVSRGGVGDPGPADVLTAWVVAPPPTLDDLADLLDLKFATRFVELLVLEIAIYLDTKDEGRDQGQYQKLTAQRDGLGAIFQRLTGVSMHAIRSAHATVETSTGGPST